MSGTILFGVCILVAAGALATYERSRDAASSAAVQLQASPTQSTTSAFTPPSNAYDGWKTYTDQANHFSVRYPPTWHVFTTTQTGVVSLAPADKPGAGISINPEVDIPTAEQSQDFQAIARARAQENTSNQILISLVTIPTLSGSTAFEMVWKGNYVAAYDHKTPTGWGPAQDESEPTVYIRNAQDSLIEFVGDFPQEIELRLVAASYQR